MSIAKRVTYLKGMAEGLGIGSGTKEERVLQLIIEILDEMSDELEALSSNVLVLDDDVSSILDDVQGLEYPNTNSKDEPPLFSMQATQAETNTAPPQQAPEFYTVKCPRCMDELTLDEDILGFGHIDCPTCNERLEFDLEDE